MNNNIELIIITIAIALMFFSIGYISGNHSVDQNQDDCFHSFDISYDCEKTGNYLVPFVDNGTKYWACGDLYNVVAC